MSCHVLSGSSFCVRIRPSEPEALWASGSRKLKVHLVPGHSYPISLMLLLRLEFRMHVAEEGKKKGRKGREKKPVEEK